MAQLFDDLSDKTKFCKFVKDHFSAAPNEIAGLMACKHNISDDRIEYAFDEYTQSISRFAVYLDSKNPDHYKRAGALLHALSVSEIVVSIDLESSSEDLESGFTRVHNADAEHVLPFVKFYETYFNQALAFHLAYRCCAAYEDNPRPYDFDYLHNVCRYLYDDANVNVEACFMLFKSIMH
ncbi:MAG: hypothetical protein ACT6TH_08555 [Brevundimonas sp.]|uniref:hypothetical protein n=1 Tax=Brevundimonas sp. TaxID=1871086 RepID=UPI0040345EBD